MLKIEPCPLSNDALLTRYCIDDHFTDCYSTVIESAVSLEQFVEAFYTTPLFKLERVLLRVFVAKPSSDQQAFKLAMGQLNAFAAWTVEQRAADQLLMCDISGRTRSWFRVARISGKNGYATRLFFGSAVVPKQDGKSGKLKLGWPFRLLLGFHKLYSNALLYSARRRLTRCNNQGV